MSLYTHLMALFSLVLLGLMVRAGFQWKYPSFVAYYALVVAGDGFFGYVGPWFDFNVLVLQPVLGSGMCGAPAQDRHRVGILLDRAG